MHNKQFIALVVSANFLHTQTAKQGQASRVDGLGTLDKFVDNYSQEISIGAMNFLTLAEQRVDDRYTVHVDNKLCGSNHSTYCLFQLHSQRCMSFGLYFHIYMLTTDIVRTIQPNLVHWMLCFFSDNLTNMSGRVLHNYIKDYDMINILIPVIVSRP